MKRVIAVAALLLAFAASSFAQGVQTGTIRGTVKDQQGLAVPGDDYGHVPCAARAAHRRQRP